VAASALQELRVDEVLRACCAESGQRIGGAAEVLAAPAEDDVDVFRGTRGP